MKLSARARAAVAVSAVLATLLVELKPWLPAGQASTPHVPNVRGESLAVAQGHPLSLLCARAGPSRPLVEVEYAAEASIANRFSVIYQKKLWDEEGGGSGPGSSLYATTTLRVVIEMVVYRYGVTSFVDSPSGTSFWWPPLFDRIRQRTPCFRYHGVDVVESVIQASSEAYAGDKLTTFSVGDITRMPLPAGFDMLLCRDALQHLPLKAVAAALRNIAAAGPKYALIGSYHTTHTQNRNVDPGDYFSINLLDAPFSLPEPVEVFDERTPDARGPAKHLLLFRGEDLARVDYDAMDARVQAHG